MTQHQLVNCDICNAEIMQASLRQHIADVHKEKKFECGICYYRAANKSTLKTHLVTHLNGIVDVFKCSVCEKGFKLKGNLKQHFKTIHGENYIKELQCNICYFITSNSSNLRTHIANVHVRSTTINCPFETCSSTFTSKKSLERHKESAHNGLRFKCQSCTYVTTQEGHLRAHTKRIHLNERDTIICKFCDKILTSSYGMKTHINKVHKGLKRKCKYCNYEASETSLGQHVKTVHQKVRFSCDICDYQATRQSHLKSHNDSVHLRLTFKCDSCNIIFSHKDRLRRHTKIKHEESIKLKDHNCQTCQFKSKYKESLLKHMASAHEGKNFKCDECGSLFTFIQALNQHVSVVHKREKKYCPYCSSMLYSKDLDEHIEKKHKFYHKCNVCDYKSLGKRNVERHMKIIHDGKERPFKCPKCPYQASRRLDILNHKKVFHIGSLAKGSSNLSAQNNENRTKTDSRFLDFDFLKK